MNITEYAQYCENNYQLINGFYGDGQKCTIRTFNNNGLHWYCVDGSVNVNCCIFPLIDGINVEMVEDIDTFTWSRPITSKAEFFKAINF